MTSPLPIDDVAIGGDVIRLGQFLKFAGLLDSGGNVKEAIIDGLVSVNGDVDRRRGRQLQIGDVVSFDGHRVRVCPYGRDRGPTATRRMLSTCDVRPPNGQPARMEK